MTKLNDNLSTLLDIEPIKFQDNTNVIIENGESLPVISDNAVDEDTEYSRKNIKELISKGNMAFDQLLHVAKESEHPRAYEVVATMIKNLSDLNKDLLELQKKKKDLSPKDYSTKSQNINVDKAVVFTGSTNELIKLIKQNKEE